MSQFRMSTQKFILESQRRQQKPFHVVIDRLQQITMSLKHLNQDELSWLSNQIKDIQRKNVKN